MLYSLARSALFQLDAEQAHELTIASFKNWPRLATAPFAGRTPDDPVRLFGLNFPNRVGLAAGLDKNGECIEAWARLGFGFIEVGTVTPRPQPGNPRPRMFRLVEQQALINRLGFNNKGVDYLLQQVAKADYSGILGINIGKNADTPIERAADDYLICLRKVYQAASYITVNISSPNTKNLRDLQDEAKLEALLKALKAEQRELAQRHGKHTPLLVKIAPDVSLAQLDHIARLAVELGIDGLIATNTTLSRPGLEREPLAKEQGGLSGAPLESLACETLRQLRSRVGKDYPLVGVGGICSGEDARARRRAGADLLQIYTGFIYQGPRLIADCTQA
ncbi:quinone-dependent dihydroorotate dehydrogenase [Solimonas sp. SE-A11]|uniref:quinone-dependent dihydroorotate dehydrogenase n=1 Tax=Solimonas sp. SE-A11 TaxID=3054954 RepID=UPI00259C8423|nr:quinone-dependent dihydroorotate dehydrogenase [Solimonas sp. SE-A11]MDM4771018.1 quinone-dependent dihydroorotate dehydrogenase [Solimonas sp. SE-A11]